MNLFVVVETGDHHATILDGDRFEPLARFPTRFALHGGPKFTPDGRYVFFMSRDGWVSKYDLWTLTMLSEVRAGINSRNIAISRDGKHIAVANYLPHTLVMLSTDDLSVEKIFEAKDKKGNSSRVSAVYQAPPRDSFIAALKDVPEIWEIATDPNAPPVYPGLVHSHEKGMVEALQSSQGLFALRRIEVPEPLDDFFFDPPYRNLVGSAREGKAIVVNLTVGRDIKQLGLARPAASRLRNFLELERAAGDGDAAFEGRQDQRAGHAGLVPDQGDRYAGAGLLHAQPREFALCLDRCHDGRQEGYDVDHRQANPRGRPHRDAGAGQDRRACRIRQERALRAGFDLGERGCPGDLRRRHLRRDQAHSDVAAVRQVQCMEQDQFLRRDQSLNEIDEAIQVALLIAAHGERSPDATNDGVKRIARAVSARGLVSEVAVGFINGVPTIGEAFAALAAPRVIVYPLFASNGYFTRDRLVQLLERGQ